MSTELAVPEAAVHDPVLELLEHTDRKLKVNAFATAIDVLPKVDTRCKIYSIICSEPLLFKSIELHAVEEEKYK